jgi:hypothetical protein
MKLKPVDLALIAIVVVVIIVAASYLLTSGGDTSEKVTTTMRFEFGSAGVPAPINPGNDTIWTEVDGVWTSTTEVNATGTTTWLFRNVTSDSNCYDQLLAAAGIGGFPVDHEDLTLGLIITGIAGDSNLQYESRAWQYYVNEVYANKACNKYALTDGDTVVWRYITNQAN